LTPAAHRQKSVVHWRRIFALTLFAGLMLAALALANSGRAAIETPPPPSVWSDKADYAPGETVTLSGANWAAGESVHIRVNDDAGETWRRDVDVAAGADGMISDQFNLPNWFVAQYTVTATGASSGTVTWTFTDSNPQTIALTPASISVVQGASAVYTVTLTIGGNTNQCNVTLAAAGLPTGATGTFATNPLVTTGSSSSPQTTTLTVATASTTPTGSYTVTVSGTNSGAGCQGPGPTAGQATLVVTPGSVNTTTTAANATATYGDASVSLNASVTPASGSAPNVGTVTFTVKKGASTIGTAGPAAVTSGTASASFSLSGVNADTYTIQVAYSGGTGFNASANATQTPTPTLIVNRASSTTTVTCPASVVYDGSAQEPCSASVTGAGGLNQPLTVNYSNNRNAGTASASASYAGDANHNGSSDSQTFTIAKRSVTASITAEDKTYDGSDAATISDCSLESESGDHGVVSPDDVDCSASNGHFEDANAGEDKTVTADVELVGDDKDNYVLTSATTTTTATIEKADSTTTVTCPASVVYDGSAQEPCSASVTGAGGLNQPLTVNYSNNRNAGTASASASYSGDANHNGSSDSQTFTIAKADLDIYAVGDSKVYDGDRDSAAVPTVSGLKGTDTVTGREQKFQSKNVLGSGNSVLEVTAYTVNDGNGGGNYDVALHTATGTITKKNLTVSGITANNKPWDGNTSATLNVGGAALVGVVPGDSVTLNTAGAVGTFASSDVGLWSVAVSGLTISGPDSGNYSLTQPATTASITAWNALGYGFYAPVGVANSIFTPAPGTAPLVNPGEAWNTAKGGSTVPLKFNVFAGSVEKTSLADIKSFQSSKLASCAGGTSDDPVETLATIGATTLRYDTTAMQWVQNWATPKVNSDTCYRAWVTFADGSSIEAFFKLKK
jgi:YDG domain/Bacterial Ig-like domain (group 3)